MDCGIKSSSVRKLRAICAWSASPWSGLRFNLVEPGVQQSNAANTIEQQVKECDYFER
jgi:hypothetical protein